MEIIKFNAMRKIIIQWWLVFIVSNLLSIPMWAQVGKAKAESKKITIVQKKAARDRSGLDKNVSFDTESEWRKTWGIVVPKNMPIILRNRRVHFFGNKRYMDSIQRLPPDRALDLLKQAVKENYHQPRVLRFFIYDYLHGKYKDRPYRKELFNPKNKEFITFFAYLADSGVIQDDTYVYGGLCNILYLIRSGWIYNEWFGKGTTPYMID